MRLSLALAVAGLANAGVMDFETAAPGSFLTAPFEQNGIRLSVIEGHYDLWSCTTLSCPAANGIVAGLDAIQTGLSTVRITLVSGGLFDLDSIRILASDGGFMVASNGSRFYFGFPGGTPTGFRGIQYLDISSSAEIAGGFLFDNVVLTPVPEPATFALVLLAFAMVRHRVRAL